jgi:hypothetical protein
MIDWGALELSGAPGATGVAALRSGQRGPYKMARTLSPSSPNQVLDAGRKVMTAWLDVAVNAQALPRDLSLDPRDGALLQAFSPELAALRVGTGEAEGVRGQAVEVIADFTLSPLADPQARFGVGALASLDGSDVLVIGIDLGLGVVTLGEAAGPLMGSTTRIHVHAILDHSIGTLIVNNRTAITYMRDPASADSDRMALFGVDGVGVSCVWSAWPLRNAIINGTL